MRAELRFWRLLDECEKLTQDEGVALSEQDYDAVRRIQGCKPEFFEELQKLGKELGMNLRESPLADRFRGLIEAEERNLDLARRMIARMDGERREMGLARQRMRVFGQGYRLETPPQNAFCSHG
jgi:hypothetical protein